MLPCDEDRVLRHSIEPFLDEVARRGSRLGGGSVAALSAALSAALLEKLTVRPPQRRALQRIRRASTRLIRRDAETFARAVEAMRSDDPAAFRVSLRAATAVQETVRRHARTVETACRAAQRAIAPRFQSDLRCAAALAAAAQRSARALIRANRAWLAQSRRRSR